MTKYSIGSYAPANEKAMSDSDLCLVCGRKLGKNPLYMEVNTSWEIIERGSDPDNSQGCWAVGVMCANKFEDGVLFRFEMAVA